MIFVIIISNNREVYLMPRRERKQSGTGIYHVMLRGINRQDIFEEAEDYWSFIRILSAVQERMGDDLATKTCTCHIQDHGDGSTNHLSRQTMRIKTVMNHNQENDQKNRPHDLKLNKVFFIDIWIQLFEHFYKFAVIMAKMSYNESKDIY